MRVSLQRPSLSSLYHDLSEIHINIRHRWAITIQRMRHCRLAFASSTEHDTVDTYLEGLRTTGHSTICDNMHARIYLTTKRRGRPTKKKASEETGMCTTLSYSNPFPPSPESQWWALTTDDDYKFMLQHTRNLKQILSSRLAPTRFAYFWWSICAYT